jgi:hypothetical protein
MGNTTSFSTTATVFTVGTTVLHCFTDAMVDFLFVKPDG